MPRGGLTARPIDDASLAQHKKRRVGFVPLEKTIRGVQLRQR